MEKNVLITDTVVVAVSSQLYYNFKLSVSSVKNIFFLLYGPSFPEIFSTIKH
jgi:hypothetical protein